MQDAKGDISPSLLHTSPDPLSLIAAGSPHRPMAGDIGCEGTALLLSHARPASPASSPVPKSYGTTAYSSSSGSSSSTASTSSGEGMSSHLPDSVIVPALTMDDQVAAPGPRGGEQSSRLPSNGDDGARTKKVPSPSPPSSARAPSATNSVEGTEGGNVPREDRRVSLLEQRLPPGDSVLQPTNGSDDNGAGEPQGLQLLICRVREVPLVQLLWIIFLAVMLMGGNACQVIFLNFWIRQFPSNLDPSQDESSSSSDSEARAEALASSYTTFVISAFIFSIFFIVLLLLYCFWFRPNLRFAKERYGWRLLLIMGAMDTLNSAMAIYAAAHTPEVLQALFTSVIPIYSATFTKWLLKDPRDYMNPYVMVSFSFIIVGITLASVANYVVHQHSSADSSDAEPLGGMLEAFLTPSATASDQRIWCLVFFFSVPPTVLLNVWQTIYMIRYTESDMATSYLQQREQRPTTFSTEEVPTPDGERETPHPPARPEDSSLLPHHEVHAHGDDTAVKLVMLAAETTLQALMSLLLLPMDALPWFGGSDSVHEVLSNLHDGVLCIWRCPHNLQYCLLYSAGFVMVYIAAAYLNRYSVTMCSMVSQLSGPITALLLLAFPVLNMTGDTAPWYISIISIALLAIGTALYVYWDEATAEEKTEGELQLKWAMMRHQERRYLKRRQQEQQQEEGEAVSPTEEVEVPEEETYAAVTRGSKKYRRKQYLVIVDQDENHHAGQ